MEFSSVLNEKFRCTKSLAGAVCKERCVERVCQPPFNQPPFGNVLFCAYKLDGCVVADGGGVAAGFFIAGQVIAAYGYRVGGVYKVQFIRQPLKMDDLAHVLGLLVNDMEKDSSLMGAVLYRLKCLPVREAVIKSFDDVCCKETGNTVFKLDGVVVNFGFDTMPFSMFAGCSGGMFAVCLADRFPIVTGEKKSMVYTSEYETVFGSGKEGNEFCLRLKRSACRNAGGKIIYRLDGEEFFNRFYCSRGVVLRAGDGG